VIPESRTPLKSKFVYSDGQIIGEYPGVSSTPTHELIYLDDLIVGRSQGTKLWYVETDHLGTPRALIDPALNTAIWKWSLAGTAFGEHAPDSDPDGNGTLSAAEEEALRAKAAGEPYDKATYNRARQKQIFNEKHRKERNSRKRGG